MFFCYSFTFIVLSVTPPHPLHFFAVAMVTGTSILCTGRAAGLQPPRSASGPLPGSAKGPTGGQEDHRSQPPGSSGWGAGPADSDSARGMAERRASVGEGEWQGVDASAFSSASSLFESPSWHAVPAPPSRAPPSSDARDPRAGPSGRGWSEDSGDTSASEELRSLRHGLRLLLRSAACLCAAQGIPWTPQQQRHPAPSKQQEHTSRLQHQMQALGKGVQLDDSYGELFALMARLLSALTKEQIHSSAGGLSERGAGRSVLQHSATAWLMEGLASHCYRMSLQSVVPARRAYVCLSPLVSCWFPPCRSEGFEPLSSSLMASAAWEEGSCIGTVNSGPTHTHFPRASAGGGAGPCVEERHYLSCVLAPSPARASRRWWQCRRCNPWVAASLGALWCSTTFRLPLRAPPPMSVRCVAHICPGLWHCSFAVACVPPFPIWHPSVSSSLPCTICGCRLVRALQATHGMLLGTERCPFPNLFRAQFQPYKPASGQRGRGGVGRGGTSRGVRGGAGLAAAAPLKP